MGGTKSSQPPPPLVGTSGAPGVAIGPIWTLRLEASTQNHGAEVEEIESVELSALAALAEAARQVRVLEREIRERGDETSADIFAAQALIAEDPALAEAVRKAAGSGRGDVKRESAAAALMEAGEAQAQLLAAIPDPYLSARAADVRDVAARAARVVIGAAIPVPTAPSILIADDLPPSVAAEIPRELLLGIALRDGSRTAHAVIVARAAGIPCIVAMKGLTIDGTLDGTMVALDGAAGELHLEPDASLIARLRGGDAQRLADATRRRSVRGTPCVLKSGERVYLYANIGSIADAQRAVEFGAEGVGLLRTEFLLLERATAPSEAEQVAALQEIFAALGTAPSELRVADARQTVAVRPLTLRLADIGGDKEVPYLRLPREQNPFLGVRGYRLAMASGRADLRELFASQIRSALIAAAASGGVLRVMAPMIAVRSEVDDLLELVAMVRVDLAARGVRGDRPAAAAADYPMQLGIMIETPAAALTVAALARGLDFVSIGTNDLTQYAMAADRVNPAVAAFQDATAPAVVALLRAVVAGAAQASVEVGVCGELAGSVAGAKLLVDLGIRELSADPAVLDEIREALIGT